MQTRCHIPFVALILALCSCQRLAVPSNTPSSLAERRVAALNQLRDQINSVYGFKDGAPRINLGPCGRFARDFRQQWNGRFDQQINIAFVMAGDDSQCHHVLVKLPDGNYYDGGNGVISGRTLLTLYPGSRIDEMTNFDPKLLDRRSYGLTRDYPICPNYSDETTARLIANCLAQLPRDAKQHQ